MKVSKDRVLRSYEIKKISRRLIEWLSAVVYADQELPEKLEYVITVNKFDRTISNQSSSISVGVPGDIDEALITEIAHEILPEMTITPIESDESDSDRYLLDYSAMIPLFKFIKDRATSINSKIKSRRSEPSTE